MLGNLLGDTRLESWKEEEKEKGMTI